MSRIYFIRGHQTSISTFTQIALTSHSVVFFGKGTFFVTRVNTNLRQKRNIPIKTWAHTVRKDFERIDEPAIYEFRRWKKRWLLLLLGMASDRTALKSISQRNKLN